MNTTTISGNLVTDPESKPYGDGSFLTDFRMANNEFVNGESVTNGFFDVTVFGAQAAHVLASVKKGTEVVATGRLDHRTYDRPDGSKGGRTRLIASVIGLSLQYRPAAHAPKAERAPQA